MTGPTLPSAPATVETETDAVFTSLSDGDARALLARNRVGRIAFTLRDRVDIEPIHYTLDGDWIFGRTSIGNKLAMLAHQPWCALQVDEVHGLFYWTSVVVKGSFYVLDPETGSPGMYARALEKIRGLLPNAFRHGDPAPHRTVLFGIYVNEITGRAARAQVHD